MRSFDEKTALLRPRLPPTTGMMFGAPAEHGIATGVAAWAARGEIPASQTTIPALPQCAL